MDTESYKETPSLLSAAFAQTDTHEKGPFRISKAPGQDWERAKFRVGGLPVSLTSQQKLIMALLITQTSINADTVKHEFGGATQNAGLKTQLTRIRNAIKGDPRTASYAALIKPLNPSRTLKELGPFKSELTGYYELDVPPSATIG